MDIKRLQPPYIKYNQTKKLGLTRLKTRYTNSDKQF